MLFYFMFHVGLETVLVPEQMAMFYKINIFPFFGGWGGGVGAEKMPQSIRVVIVIRLLLSAGSVHCEMGYIVIIIILVQDLC